jgi:hypothetical protein
VPLQVVALIVAGKLLEPFLVGIAHLTFGSAFSNHQDVRRTHGLTSRS